MFKVQWKAEDIMWLPFDQVDHFGALHDYLNILGINDISDLTDGNRLPDYLSVSLGVSNTDS